MKRKIVWLTLFLFALWFAGCAKKEAQEEHAEEHHSDVVTLTEEGIKLAGIKIEKIAIRNVPVEFSAAGKVGFNERKVVHITARVSGWVDEVFGFMGDRVKLGDSLACLYSPEFLSAQSEFIQAEERLKSVTESDSLEYRTAQSLFNSARSRLILFGLGEEELAQLSESHQPSSHLIIKSPIQGAMVETRLIAGNTVDKGADLLRIADLSSLWVIADIYEKDIRVVQKGQRVKIRVASLGGRAFAGTVEAINDVLDETTRTFKVRISVENPTGELKPEMFCEVLFSSQSSRPILAVPAAAVQRLGDEQFV
ncbi:MAG: efflux RND transporter periplasmic adaptor subunit, partial [Limisphaerales bacterium]